MNVDTKVEVLLNERAFDDHGPFPKVLYQDAIVHVLSDFAPRDLDRHGELLKENQGILQQPSRFLWASAVNASALVAPHYAVLKLEGRIEQAGSKSTFRLLYLAVFHAEGVSLIHFVVQVLQLQIVALVLADVVPIDQNRRQSQVLDQETLLLVPVDAVLRDLNLQVVCRVPIPLDLDPAVVIHPKIVLLDVNHSTDVLIDRVRQPADIHSRVDLRSDQVRLVHAEVARIDEHQRATN